MKNIAPSRTLSKVPPVAFAILSIVSCASSGPKGQGKAVELLTYEPKVEEQTLSSATLRLPWRLENPTEVTTAVAKMSWLAELDGKPVAQEDVTPAISASPNGSAEDMLTVSLPFDTSEAGFVERLKKNQIPYTVRAEVTVQKADTTELFEAEWSGNLFPPRSPQVNLKAEAGKYEDKGMEFHFVLGILNPNPFPLRVDGVSFVLKVNGTEIRQDTVVPGQRLGPSQEAQFQIDRFIGKDDLQDLAQELLQLEEIPYSLEGRAKVAELDLPVKASGAISFAR